MYMWHHLITESIMKGLISKFYHTQLDSQFYTQLPGETNSKVGASSKLYNYYICFYSITEIIPCFNLVHKDLRDFILIGTYIRFHRFEILSKCTGFMQIAHLVFREIPILNIHDTA